MHLLTKKLFNTNYNHTFVLLNNEVIKTLSINLLKFPTQINR